MARKVAKAGLVIVCVFLAFVVVGLFLGLVNIKGVFASSSDEKILETKSPCPYIRLNQIARLDNVDNQGNGAFVAPENIPYTHVKFNEFGAVIDHASFPVGNFNLNGIDCKQLPDKSKVIEYLDLTECIGDLRDGINSFHNSPARKFDLHMINASSFEFDFISYSNESAEKAIVKAEHLDENRNFISDITQKVSNLDGVWSEKIPEGHYVRVEFDRPLSNSWTPYTLYNYSYINIHPRFEYANGSQAIVIYEADQNEIFAHNFGNSALKENQNNTFLLWQMGLQNNTYIREILLEMEIRPANC